MDSLKSSEELANIISDKEKELQATIKARATVEQTVNELVLQKLQLAVKIKELSNSLDKAKFNERILSSELRDLTSKFWLSKKQGM